MRRRLTLAAIAVAATFAAAPAARASFAFVDEGHDGHLLIVLWETGPAQDVTIDPSVPGNPALTADAPGAQRVDITDTADSFDFSPYPEPPNCWTPSTHHTQCLADPQKQAAWRTSTCYYPPGCTGPGPSGLLAELTADLPGNDVRLRDDPDGVPIDLNVNPTNANGTRTVTLSSARFVNYDDSYGGRDRVFLHLKQHTPRPELHEFAQSQISTGPGDDLVRSRDDAQEWIGCGEGNDVVVAGPEDTVSADCENVSTG
jgi:hypothetical protein